MSFTFGTPKTTAASTLPTTTSSSTGFQFGAAGDAKFSSKSGTALPFVSAVTGTPTATAPTGFNLSSTATTSAAPQFSFSGTAATTTTTTTTSSGLSFTLTTTTAPALLNVPAAATSSLSSTTTAVTSSVFPLTTATTSKQTVGIASSVTTVAPTTAASSVALATTSTSSVTSGLGTTGTLTFAQLEDSINKWTIYLEDEGKHFFNQAKQINAWDRLLINNGEKILSLSNGIERVKQQQQQLDQELDFVLAQQKELEDLIVPLEKALVDIPITDIDRNRTYQMAETVDSQLKQMSEDLKEVIEQLNETNRNQEMSNPITQIGKILNAHMNSLQWIDRNTTKITTHLDQIAKMHDMNKRNHELNLQKTYD